MRKLLVLLVALAVAIPLSAATASWEFSSVGSSLNNGSGYSLGEVFTVNTTFTLDFLGYYGSLGNFAESHPVSIYDASGNLLDSTTIDNTSVFTDGFGNFVYNPVTPITIFAGQTYVIDGASGFIDPYVWNDSSFTVYAPINLLGDNWIGGNGDYFTGTTPIGDVADGFWGPVFGFDAQFTPEPGTMLLAGTALLGAGLLRRRKKA